MEIDACPVYTRATQQRKPFGTDAARRNVNGRLRPISTVQRSGKMKKKNNNVFVRFGRFGLPRARSPLPNRGRRVRTAVTARHGIPVDGSMDFIVRTKRLKSRVYRNKRIFAAHVRRNAQCRDRVRLNFITSRGIPELTARNARANRRAQLSGERDPSRIRFHRQT